MFAGSRRDSDDAAFVFVRYRWYTFNACNNTPRIGRVLIAQGRDAADVPIVKTFGPNTLVSFKVWTASLCKHPIE